MSLVIPVLAPLRGDAGDVESSHDYPGFTRPTGFVISDFDEDNPAEFSFPVSQPLADDADHVVTVPVKGHRYVIRYELAAGERGLSLFQTQQYYEKLASDGGFTVEKSGAVGDVTETFFKATASHTIWVCLAPAVTSNVVTIVEGGSEDLPPGPPRLTVNTATLPPPPVAPKPIPTTPNLTPPPETPPAPAQVPSPPPAPAPVASVPALAPSPPSAPDAAPDATPDVAADPNGDALFSDLTDKGRVVLPFVFKPGKEVLDDSSQPLIDRVVAMMKAHPDLFLRIEGHTDNTGYPDDNLRLSAGRALAIQSKLVAAHVEKKRVDAVGVGGLQPIANNATADGRGKKTAESSLSSGKKVRPSTPPRRMEITIIRAGRCLRAPGCSPYVA